MTKAQREKIIRKAFSGTEVGALAEEFMSQVKLVAEQHGSLVKDIKDIKTDLGGFKEEMTDFKEEMREFRSETKENFKLVMDHLSRIEDDFLDLRRKIEKLNRDKISVKEFKWLKDKVLEIENRLEKYKKQQSILSIKA